MERTHEEKTYEESYYPEEWQEKNRERYYTQASVGTHVEIAAGSYVPPRQPEDPAGGPGTAPSGWRPPSPTGRPMSNPESPEELQIDIQTEPSNIPANSEDGHHHAKQLLEIPSTSGGHSTYCDLPAHNYTYPREIFAGMDISSTEYIHLRVFFALPMDTYRSVNDLAPEVASMTTETYSQMMRGMVTPQSKAPLQALRRASYKFRATKKKQRVNQENQDLKRQLQEARTTIITLQGKLLQLTERGATWKP